MPVLKAKPLKNKKLFVSAVIAAYNEELHLRRCVESLLNQSYSPMEIIIVENGESRDKTYEIAKEFAGKNKNVRAFSIPGKQKGPGNAWNFGIKKAKGEIIIICGADLIYGKDYVKLGIAPIVKGDSVGISHFEETCDNPENLWARAFFYKRRNEFKSGLSRVFTVVRKDFVKSHPFNSELGYADDQTVYRTEGIEFPCVNLKVSQINPASFSDTWDHSRWVGRSLKRPLLIAMGLPLLPFYAVYKTILHLKVDFYPSFIFFLPVYYSVRYLAYFTEALKKLT